MDCLAFIRIGAIAVFVAACNTEPSQRGVASLARPSNPAKDIATNRELCAQRGDTHCGAYLEDLAAQTRIDPSDWPHPVWFGHAHNGPTHNSNKSSGTPKKK